MLRLREEGRDAIESAKCQRCLLGEILQVLIHDNGRDGRQGSGNKCTAGLPQGRNGKIMASESSFHAGMCNFRRLKLHIPACYAISIIHRLTVFPHAASARLPHIVCGRRLRGCRCAGICYRSRFDFALPSFPSSIGTSSPPTVSVALPSPPKEKRGRVLRRDEVDLAAWLPGPLVLAGGDLTVRPHSHAARRAESGGEDLELSPVRRNFRNDAMARQDRIRGRARRKRVDFMSRY